MAASAVDTHFRNLKSTTSNPENFDSAKCLQFRQSLVSEAASSSASSSAPLAGRKSSGARVERFVENKQPAAASRSAAKRSSAAALGDASAAPHKRHAGSPLEIDLCGDDDDGDSTAAAAANHAAETSRRASAATADFAQGVAAMQRGRVERRKRETAVIERAALSAKYSVQQLTAVAQRSGMTALEWAEGHLR